MLIKISLVLGLAVGVCLPWVQGAEQTNSIDAIVVAALKVRGISPSERCTDEVFIRRVFLDAIGTLPTASEVRQFLADQDPVKRDKCVTLLLNRPEFAEYLGLKWGDLLRIKSEFPSNLWPNAVQAYDRWVRESFRTNKPYDQFVRELLTASGSNFRQPALESRTTHVSCEGVCESSI